MQTTTALAAQRQIASVRTAAYTLRAVGEPRLAELLDGIATAWRSASERPELVSTTEALRWSMVCVKAARIAEETNR